jgi:hypothetical protein
VSAAWLGHAAGLPTHVERFECIEPFTAQAVGPQPLVGDPLPQTEGAAAVPLDVLVGDVEVLVVAPVGVSVAQAVGEGAFALVVGRAQQRPSRGEPQTSGRRWLTSRPSATTC